MHENHLLSLVVPYFILLVVCLHFKDFSTLEILGKGGFASVYRAKCLKSGFDVALKVVSELK